MEIILPTFFMAGLCSTSGVVQKPPRQVPPPFLSQCSAVVFQLKGTRNQCNHQLKHMRLQMQCIQTTVFVFPEPLGRTAPRNTYSIRVGDCTVALQNFLNTSNLCNCMTARIYRDVSTSLLCVSGYLSKSLFVSKHISVRQF